MEQFMVTSGLLNAFSGNTVWIGVAYVVGVFLVLAWRPQQIVQPAVFRRSYILFALYVIVPASLNFLLWLLMVSRELRRGNESPAMFALQFTDVVGKVLLGLSVCLALASMAPRHPPDLTQPAQAGKEDPF